jgi:PTH2 family peptidyl-tRNA hydrolase
LKQAIVLRKDLNMRKGKMVAQGAHASMAAVLDDGLVIDHPYIREWLEGLFTKICLSVPDEDSLLEIHGQALDAGLPCSLIQDSGLTEFGGVKTYTAVAVGPGPREEIDKITGDLKLL